MRTVALVPALNEESPLGSVLLLARGHVDELHVIDDGSRDRTSLVAQTAGARVTRFERNGGKGAALRHGFASAIKEGYDVVVTLDGDGQHDPASIPGLLAPIVDGKADLVIGSRRLQAADRRNIPRHRRAGQFAFALAARSMTKSRITDTESGFRAYRTDLLSKLNLTEDGFGVEWEVLQQATATGARIVEIPIEARYLRPPARAPLVHGWMVGASILRFLRGQHPLAFFAAPGAAFLAVGIILGFQTASHYYADGEFWVGKAMLSLLFTLLGAIGIASGLILDAIHVMLRRVGT